MVTVHVGSVTPETAAKLVSQVLVKEVLDLRRGGKDRRAQANHKARHSSTSQSDASAKSVQAEQPLAMSHCGLPEHLVQVIIPRCSATRPYMAKEKRLYIRNA